MNQTIALRALSNYENGKITKYAFYAALRYLACKGVTYTAMSRWTGIAVPVIADRIRYLNRMG